MVNMINTSMNSDIYIKKENSKYRKEHTFEQHQTAKAFDTAETKQYASVQDIYELLKPKVSKEEYVKKQDSLVEESGRENVAETDIIVKPDGSRVLVVTMNMGGMETTMSLEISKPTIMQNDNSEQNNTTNENMADIVAGNGMGNSLNTAAGNIVKNISNTVNEI